MLPPMPESEAPQYKRGDQVNYKSTEGLPPVENTYIWAVLDNGGNGFIQYIIEHPNGFLKEDFLLITANDNPEISKIDSLDDKKKYTYAVYEELILSSEAEKEKNATKQIDFMRDERRGIIDMDGPDVEIQEQTATSTELDSSYEKLDVSVVKALEKIPANAWKIVNNPTELYKSIIVTTCDGILVFLQFEGKQGYDIWAYAGPVTDEGVEGFIGGIEAIDSPKLEKVFEVVGSAYFPDFKKQMDEILNS